MNVLITGSTGNVGRAILSHINFNLNKIWKASYKLPLQDDELYFNFEEIEKTKESLGKFDTLFLLRPPHISDTTKYFQPLIEACKQKEIKHIVFLSVQGAEKSSIIPHNKIEKLIVASGIPYTFIRPSYFMQNLTTTRKEDIQSKALIFLPAGNAKFLWVDVNDIGKAVAVVLNEPERHLNKIYIITGRDLYTFGQVAEMVSSVTDQNVTYKSPSLISFYLTKRKEGATTAYIFVLIMLHYLARFEKEPVVSKDYTMLTHTQPNTLLNFIRENIEALTVTKKGKAQ